MKNKKTILTVSILAVVVLLVALFWGGYNSMVDAQTNVEKAQSDIQAQLERRADLIPNFVATVKGYTDYEQETLTAVTNARAAVTNAGNAADLAKANDGLNSAIDVWVNAVTEAYPDLKANANYVALQDELAGTENRIAVARTDYNEVAKKYNAMIRRFPKNIIAGLFGFDAVDYFSASSGAEKVPQVSFE